MDGHAWYKGWYCRTSETMSEAEIITHASRALLLVLILSLPPIAVAAFVGVGVALIQALTQVQEQTISFAFKLAAIILVIFATSGWIGSELIAYGADAFARIETVK